MTVNFRSRNGHNVVKAKQWFVGSHFPGISANTKLVDGVYEVDGTGFLLGETIQSSDWVVEGFGGDIHVFSDAEFQKVFEAIA